MDLLVDADGVKVSRRPLQHGPDSGATKPVSLRIGGESVPGKPQRAAGHRSNPDVAMAVFGERRRARNAMSFGERPETLAIELRRAVHGGDPDVSVRGLQECPDHSARQSILHGVSGSRTRDVRQLHLADLLRFARGMTEARHVQSITLGADHNHSRAVANPQSLLTVDEQRPDMVGTLRRLNGGMDHPAVTQAPYQSP